MQSSRDISADLLLWIAGECPSHAPLAGGPSLSWITLQCIVKKVALVNEGGRIVKVKVFNKLCPCGNEGSDIKQWRWQGICKAGFLWLIVLHVSLSVTTLFLTVSVTTLILLSFLDLTGQSATLILQAII